ncbi:vWA domain-containing protein [Pirellulaceae bacterium SH501]
MNNAQPLSLTTYRYSLRRLSALRMLRTPTDADSRKGSLVLFATAVFLALGGLAGLAINIAYMEMLRTEQRVVTDAAAKSALVVLGQTQSRQQAIATAKSIAALHRVAGRPVQLQDSDIRIGASVMRPNGTFQFTEVPGDSAAVTNSVRVACSLNRVVEGGVPIIMMPQMMGNSKYQLEQFAAATRIEMDVCVVVDRSGSMAWSLGSQPFEYPGDLAGKSPIQNYFQLPHPTLSRWSALRNAMNVFVTVLEEAPIKSRVALASYSSNFTFGVWSSIVASIDEPLTTTYSSIPARLDTMAQQPLIGNTNIAAGLREGINALTDPSKSRITSSKTIILLTDGIKTQGDDPVELANYARQMNIRIHTIAFSAQADIPLMTSVAHAGGGQCYVAPDAESLTETFRTIAATLPNMLTE